MNESWLKSMHYCQIQRNFRGGTVAKICANKRIFKHTDMEVPQSTRFLDKVPKHDISHAFLPLTVAKLSMLKNSPF